MSLYGHTLVSLTRNSRISIQVSYPVHNYSYLGALYFYMCCLFQSDDPVPSYYVMILESLDGFNDNLVINITVERNGEIVDMRTEETVRPNLLWRASILAYGCESDMVVINYQLSKLERISVQ